MKGHDVTAAGNSEENIDKIEHMFYIVDTEQMFYIIFYQEME